VFGNYGFKKTNQSRSYLNHLVSNEKQKYFLLEGRVPSKTCPYNKLLEMVNSFSYLRYSISFTHDADIQNKITKFGKMLGTINSVMKPLLGQKHTQNNWNTMRKKKINTVQQSLLFKAHKNREEKCTNCTTLSYHIIYFPSINPYRIT